MKRHAGFPAVVVRIARPTAPPFVLWDRTATPPESDRATDRPYCGLRYHAASDNLFICGFSGVDILMATCLTWAVNYHQTLPEVLASYREHQVARPAYALAVEANGG